MLPSSVQVTELLWTLGGIPGLIIWFFHGKYAHSVYMTALKVGGRSERAWAAMTLFLTAATVTIEISAIIVGIFGMTQQPVRQQISLLGWAVTIHILLVSFAILLIGVVWGYAARVLRSEIEHGLQ